jgi:hypothetical protein
VVVADATGQRWKYQYRERASGRERLVELVTVLRAVRAVRSPLDYYEYSVLLETSPDAYVADRPVFESLLATVTFSVPER